MSDIDTITQLVQLTQNLAQEHTVLAQPLTDLIATTLQTAGRSSATQRSYQTAIGLFIQYLDQQRGGHLPAELAQHWRPFAAPTTEGKRTIWHFRPPSAVLRLVDAAVLDGFQAARRAAGDSAATAMIRIYPVRTLLSIAYRDGVVTADQARTMNLKVYRPQTRQSSRPVGRRLTPAEVRALRAAVPTTSAKGKRDRAILDLMLFLGLRREEVTDLDLSAFQQDGGRWWLIVMGKREKVRRLKIHDVLFESLASWLTCAHLALSSTGPMFRSFDRGDHITAKGIDASVIGRLVATYGAEAGLAPATGKHQLGAHDLRRTCARNAYDNGASLLLIQALLGHDDPKTTAYYIGAFENDQETAVDFVRY